MIRWSNRSASLGLSVLLAACRSAPQAPPPPVPHDLEAKSAAGTPAAAGEPASVPPQAAEAYARALQAARDGQQGSAVLKFRELAEAYPTYAGPEVNLGLLYAQAGRLADAQTAFETALERNPQDAVAGNELGIVLRKRGKFAEAEAAYQRTITAQPTYAPAHLNLGILYDLYLGEPQKALEQFEQYIQIAGENKQVAGWLAELRKRDGAAGSPAKKEAS